MKSGKRLRQLAAACMLIATSLAAFEPAFGLLRDGSVHHEGAVAAAQHAATTHGDHGHEHRSESSDQKHGPGHGHGTSIDHCTHVHGSALTGNAHAFTTVVTEVAARPTDFLLSSDPHTARLFHPPKA